MTEETDKQRATRSALGGFERDAKTFDGHWQKIQLSASNFVKRHARFGQQEPGHPRLAETAELLAQARRIIGQEVPGILVTEEPAPTSSAPEGYGTDTPAPDVLADAVAWGRVDGIETAVAMLARMAIREGDGLERLADTDAALSYLTSWLGHLAPVTHDWVTPPLREMTPAELDDAAAIEHPAAGPLPDAVAAASDAQAWKAPDPAAGLISREQERIQKALDDAAAKQAPPVNPLAAAFAQKAPEQAVIPSVSVPSVQTWNPFAQAPPTMPLRLAKDGS